MILIHKHLTDFILFIERIQMDNINEITKILIPILTIFVGLLVYIWNKQTSEIENLKKEQKEIKHNYLTRFEEVNKNINNGFLEIKLLFVQYSTKLDNLLKAHEIETKNKDE